MAPGTLRTILASVLPVAIAHAPPVLAQNLVTNGGFEEPLVANLWATHVTGTELTGWNSFSTYRGTVLFTAAYDPVPQGSQAVQIEVPGDWISQTINTVVGQTYVLSLDLGAYSVYGGPGLGYQPCPCASVLDVLAGPATAKFNGSSAAYVQYSLEFTADSALTTIKLMNPSVPSGWGNYPQVDNIAVVPKLPPPFLTVAIDIKPGSSVNSINLGSKGVTPVAILSTATFNAVDVDVDSVTFAGASPVKFAYEDANADGIADLVLHFHTQELQLSATSIQATLTGKLSGGMPLTGTDSVRIVPAAPRPKP